MTNRLPENRPRHTWMDASISVCLAIIAAAFICLIHHVLPVPQFLPLWLRCCLCVVSYTITFVILERMWRLVERVIIRLSEKERSDDDSDSMDVANNHGAAHFNESNQENEADREGNAQFHSARWPWSMVNRKRRQESDDKSEGTRS